MAGFKGMNLAEKNGMWKGDNIKYFGIHVWVRTHYPKKQCEYCGAVKDLHIANITGNYNRDFLNWRRLCRSCHMKLDIRTGVRKHTLRSKTWKPDRKRPKQDPKTGRFIVTQW